MYFEKLIHNLQAGLYDAFTRMDLICDKPWPNCSHLNAVETLLLPRLIIMISLLQTKVLPTSPEVVVPPSEKVSDVSPTKSFPRSNNISCTNTPETENRLDIHLETLHAHLDTCAVANIRQIDGINDSDEVDEVPVTLNPRPAVIPTLCRL